MVDRIVAWFRALPNKFIAWWEKFSRRQKITIVSLAIATIIAFAVLIFAVTRPEYIRIHTAESAKEAQEVIDLLEGEDIAYITSEDGLQISIKREDYTKANLLLGSNSITTDAMTIQNVTDSGFFTTESNTQKKYIVYLQDFMKKEIESYSFVKSANVQLKIPEEDGTLISQNKESYAAVQLELSDVCTAENAQAMARFVATALGNDTTENVTILDTDGNLLFAGTNETSTYGAASNQYALQAQVSKSMRDEVIRILTATNQFSSIDAAVNVVLDNSYTENANHLYWAPEGREEGMLASKDLYNSTNQGGISGEPGTDSNTETSYQYEDNQYSSSAVTEESYDYLPDESTMLQQIPAGAIKYDQSSLSVTTLTYRMVREDDVKEQGLLDGITWEQYKINNDARTKLEVDPDLIQAVSTATGIGVKNITILSYEEPFFIDHVGLAMDLTDILTLVLIVLIMGLLAFVIFRSMHQAGQEEAEPEVSIDEILQSTPQEELEEIGVEDKSEARKIVEKFVEDNPDAAANLLRNWLNEDM